MKSSLKVKFLSHSYCQLCSFEDYGKVKGILCYKKLEWRGGKPKYFTYRLVYKNSLKFYTGLLPYLNEHFDINLIGQKPARFPERPLTLPRLEGIKFYRDQVKVFRQAMSKSRGVIKAPTGSGKTVLGAGLIRMYNPVNCFFLVHTQDLLYQTREEFERLLGQDVGIVGDGQYQLRPVTVATVQSMGIEELKRLDFVDMVIVDECHHASGGMYRKVLNRMYRAGVRYGLTATPRKDEEGAMWTRAVLGEQIASVSTKELVDKGRLAKPEVMFYKVPWHKDIAVLSGYRQVYNKGIIYYQARNRIICDVVKELKRNGSVLVHVKEVKHGEELERFGAVRFVHGGTDVDIRMKVKEALKRKTELAVCCTDVWGEGTDIPSLDAIVFAGGGLSEIKVLQKIGRGLRKKKGRNVVRVVDFVDMQHEYLRRHSRERYRIYEDEGWEISGVDWKEFDGRRIRK